ncbi:hypothetical protein N7448_011326 [Penicillium atrosanguineum]|nr:hypothetical protein N7448_011326 [Penicillium atrosanguineum]
MDICFTYGSIRWVNNLAWPINMNCVSKIRWRFGHFRARILMADRCAVGSALHHSERSAIAASSLI